MTAAHRKATLAEDPIYALAACAGKASFASASLAWAVARRKPAREAYRCECCGRWHIGVRDKVARRKRPS